jgi:hypothetical protein
MTTLTLDEFHALHPWPSRYGDGKRVEFLWPFDLAAPPDAVWRATSDTSRLNRALGTSEMRFTEKDGQRFGWSKSGGRVHTWREVPWSWVAGQWLECVRIYDRGYPRLLHAVQRVEPRGDGSRFYAYFGFVPRGAVGAAALRLGFGALHKDYRRVLAELDRQLTSAAGAILPAAPPTLPDDTRARLDAIARELRGKGLDGDGVDRLVGFVATGDELEVGRIQVRERARAWGLDEDRLLAVCLHATRAGLLELSWDIVCPHCRG